MFDGERETFEEDAPLSEVPETPAVETAPETSGQPRDDKGRFASAPPEEPPVDEAPVLPPETTEPTSVEPLPEEPDEVFSFRADQQDWEIPGSAVGEDGVFIPRDQIHNLQQLLSEGHAARGSVRQRLSEAAAREQSAAKRAEASEAQSKHVLGFFEQMVEQSQREIQSGDISQIANSPLGQWLLNIGQRWPILKAQSEAQALKIAQEAERAELERYRNSERQQALRPVMQETLERYVSRFGNEYGLDEEQQAALFELMSSDRYQQVIWVPAPGDDPVSGFRKGDTVINWGPIQDAASLMATGRKPQTLIQKAMKENQAQTTTKSPPPTVGGKGAKAPRPGPKVPTFASAKEADAWFQKGGYNDLETPEE